jgi:hypothetical protein
MLTFAIALYWTISKLVALNELRAKTRGEEKLPGMENSLMPRVSVPPVSRQAPMNLMKL